MDLLLLKYGLIKFHTFLNISHKYVANEYRFLFSVNLKYRITKQSFRIKRKGGTKKWKQDPSGT